MDAATLAEPTPALLFAITAVMLMGGFVKGAVGFALPIVALAGLGVFLTAQEALALLLVPSTLSNVWQTLRQGWAPALATFTRFWRLNLAMAVFLFVTAQLVPRLASDTLFVIVGVAVTAVAALQLVGWQPSIGPDARHRGWVDTGVGAFCGAVGGMTGVWGPAVLYYLIALGTEKQAQVRMLGLNFLIGWWVLSGAHVTSGILNSVTLPYSCAMLLPVLAGMWLGLKVQDRLGQSRFRQVTMFVLFVAGLNLLRKGLF